MRKRNRPQLEVSARRRRSLDAKEQRLCELEMSETVLREQIDKLESAARETEDSRNKFAALYEYSPVGYIVFDFKGRVHEANAAASSLFGFDLAKRPMVPFAFLLHPEDVSRFLDHLARCQQMMARKLTTHLRIRGRARDEFRAVELMTAQFKTRDATMFLTALVDLEERRKYALAAVQADEFAQGIVETIHEPLVVLDFTLKIVSANRAFAAFVGRHKSRLQGMFFESLFNLWWSGNPLRDALEGVFLGSGTLQNFELQAQPHGREMRILLLNARRLEPRGDSPACILVAIEDITERRRAEEQLRRANQELEDRVTQRTSELKASYEQMESFCYSIAHDLRAPLRSICGFSELLGSQFADAIGPQGADYTQRIRESAQRMDALIQDLLNYGRLNTASLALGPVNLEDVFRQVLALLEKEIEEKQATVQKKNPLPLVYGHQVVLQVMLTNLVSNALKFVGPGVRPNVVVRHEDKGPSVRIWIEDNGIGIAERDQKRIFGVFQRLHSSQAYPGTGIGLAIVSRGVERMLGHAGVESDVGKGSRFWIELQKGSAPGERAVSSNEVSAQPETPAPAGPPRKQARLPGLSPDEMRGRPKEARSKAVSPHIIPFPQRKPRPKPERKQAS